MTPRTLHAALLARLPHPLSEVLYQVGLHRWSEIVHDRTVPAHKPDGFARRVTP